MFAAQTQMYIQDESLIKNKGRLENNIPANYLMLGKPPTCWLWGNLTLHIINGCFFYSPIKPKYNSCLAGTDTVLQTEVYLELFEVLHVLRLHVLNLILKLVYLLDKSHEDEEKGWKTQWWKSNARITEESLRNAEKSERTLRNELLSSWRFFSRQCLVTPSLTHKHYLVSGVFD